MGGNRGSVLKGTVTMIDGTNDEVADELGDPVWPGLGQEQIHVRDSSPSFEMVREKEPFGSIS